MKQLVVIGVCAVILSACSSGGDATPSTLSPATTPATTSTLPADTVPATTSTSTSTTSTSTATTTTLAPATTASPSTEDLIKQAVQDYFLAYETCGQAPDQCDPTSFVASEGPSQGVLTDMVSSMMAQGIYFSTDLRGSYFVVETITADSAVEAQATYCAYDAGVVLGPPGPDGQPTTVNDAVSSIRYTFRLFRENGIWKVGEQRELERLGGGNLCPPAS